MTEAQRADYVEHGSDRHAEMLRLVKADKNEELQLEGWTLEDKTAWGPEAMAHDMKFLREILAGKVRTLKSGPPPAPQSEDPLAPNYAPPILEEPVLDH
jgi:hypothetical protein